MNKLIGLIAVVLSAISASGVYASTDTNKVQNLLRLGEYYFTKENRTDADIDNAFECWSMALNMSPSQFEEIREKYEDELTKLNFFDDYVRNEVVDMEDNTARGVIGESDIIYTAVEEMPEFPGGISALMTWLSQNIVYPEEALEKGIEGRVIVKFLIETDGSVGCCSVVRGVDKLLDDESLRVVSSMPKWKPGKSNGKSVRCYYTLPINFKMTAKDNDSGQQ